MSVKVSKVAAIKKKRGAHSRTGLIYETYLKAFDAQERLGKSCCIFIKTKDEFRFLILANNAPEFKTFDNFLYVAIGASTGELGEVKDILQDLNSEWNGTFDREDFYSTVALYFLSRYLKGVIEEFWSSRALAVEFIIFDPTFDVLHTIRSTGDYESFQLREIDNIFILAGCHNTRMKKELAKELQKCFDKSDLSDKTLVDLGNKFCKKYGLRVLALLSPRVIEVSKSDVRAPAKPSSPDSQER